MTKRRRTERRRDKETEGQRESVRIEKDRAKRSPPASSAEAFFDHRSRAKVVVKWMRGMDGLRQCVDESGVMNESADLSRRSQSQERAT
jgi:hypothetical protein